MPEPGDDNLRRSMTMGKTTNLARLSVASILFALAILPLLPLSARGCSCATPSDLHEWVDQSEAVFVGTLVDKRAAGDGFGTESVYVFEVEEWIKGDAGEVIEVLSASDGAGCGFEFWDVEQRLGAAIHLDGDTLRGGLCSQIDPEVALVLKEGMATSKTGIPRILAGNGWQSTRLTVLDADGGHIGDFSPPPGAAELDGTQLLEACPGGELVVQVTTTELIVWDTATFHPVAVHDIGVANQWGSDVSCRAEDASTIWLLTGSDAESVLVEVGSGASPILTLPGTSGRIGIDYVLSQAGPEGDITWVDVATGERTPITETPSGELWSISAAPHPSEPRVAVVETRFDEASTAATLSIVEEGGTRSSRIELPWEAYSPVWVGQEQVLITGYDWEVSEQPTGLLVDVVTGEVVSKIEGWEGTNAVAVGEQLFGVRGGSVLEADLTSGAVEILSTLPTLNAGPLLILEDTAPIEMVTTTIPAIVTTVPPLVAPGNEAAPESQPEPNFSAYSPWIGGGAMLIFFGLLAWLAWSPPGRPSDSA